MRLSKRQAEAVNQIIQEEAQGVLRARDERHDVLRQDRVSRRLTEANGFEEELGQFGGTLRSMQHELHEMMEAMIAEHGDDAAYEAVMAAWNSASQEVASGTDRD